MPTVVANIRVEAVIKRRFLSLFFIAIDSLRSLARMISLTVVLIALFRGENMNFDSYWLLVSKLE